MKINILFLSICLIAVQGKLCMAQPGGASQGTNWGKRVQGVQLSISMTNSVVTSGSPSTVATIMQNTSTNVATLFKTRGWTDFDLLLTNSAGKRYDLSPMPADVSRFRVTLRAGDDMRSTIPVTFGKNVEPGEYILIARRIFYIKSEKWEIESNLLKVRVK